MKYKIYINFFLVLLLGLWMVRGQAQTLHELVLTVDITNPSNVANNSFSAGNNTIMASSSKNHFVVGVNYISGPRIFSSNTLTGKSTVKGTIIRGGKENYVYKLHYTLGSDTKVYVVTAAIMTK